MRAVKGVDAANVGAETLERLAVAERFNAWMFERLAPWVGQRVLEVGSGIGNLSQFLVDRERVILTDTEAAYRSHLSARFADHPRLDVRALTLPDTPEGLVAERLDTVVCLNVLEHIPDDAGSLVAMRKLLVPGGRVVLLVPAHQVLFGSLDEALIHCRRYSAAMLRERLRDAGLIVRHLEAFNLAGIPGWWLVGKVLRRRVLPIASLRLYNALVPLFRLERFLPWRTGLSIIAIGERPTVT